MKNDDAPLAEEKPEGEGEGKRDPRKTALDWGLTLAIPIAIAIFVHAFVLEAFIVPTGSMLNTIQLNDRVWAEKVSYRFKSPEKGEVVLSKYNDRDTSRG